jgi:hypothetical protein
VEGIQYVTNDNGKRVAVQIDLRQHAGMWEDIQDAIVANSRRQEKSVPLERVKASLIKRGRLRG